MPPVAQINVGTATQAAALQRGGVSLDNPANALTRSDKGLLLNALGVTVTPRGDGFDFQMPEGTSVEDTKAAGRLAMQMMLDRQRGAINGDVSSSYPKELLDRAGYDINPAFENVLNKAPEYLGKGSPVTRVNEQA